MRNAARPEGEVARLIFAGLDTRRARLERLVAELAALYERGARTIVTAQRDRDRIPELDASARRLEAGVEALVRAALGDAPEPSFRLVLALADPHAWQSFRRHGIPPEQVLKLMSCAVSEPCED